MRTCSFVGVVFRGDMKRRSSKRILEAEAVELVEKELVADMPKGLAFYLFVICYLLFVMLFKLGGMRSTMVCPN